MLEIPTHMVPTELVPKVLHNMQDIIRLIAIARDVSLDHDPSCQRCLEDIHLSKAGSNKCDCEVS